MHSHGAESRRGKNVSDMTDADIRAMAGVTSAAEQLGALRAGAAAAGFDLTGLPAEQVVKFGHAHGQLLAERDRLVTALARLIDEVCIEIGTPEYRDRVLAEVERARAVLHAVKGDQGVKGGADGG